MISRYTHPSCAQLRSMCWETFNKINTSLTRMHAGRLRGTCLSCCGLHATENNHVQCMHQNNPVEAGAYPHSADCADNTPEEQSADCADNTPEEQTFSMSFVWCCMCAVETRMPSTLMVTALKTVSFTVTFTHG